MTTALNERFIVRFHDKKLFSWWMKKFLATRETVPPSPLGKNLLTINRSENLVLFLSKLNLKFSHFWTIFELIFTECYFSGNILMVGAC